VDGWQALETFADGGILKVAMVAWKVETHVDVYEDVEILGPAGPAHVALVRGPGR
jgi:hypothetical protein